MARWSRYIGYLLFIAIIVGCSDVAVTISDDAYYKWNRGHVVVVDRRYIPSHPHRYPSPPRYYYDRISYPIQYRKGDVHGLRANHGHSHSKRIPDRGPSKHK